MVKYATLSLMVVVSFSLCNFVSFWWIPLSGELGSPITLVGYHGKPHNSYRTSLGNEFSKSLIITKVTTYDFYTYNMEHLPSIGYQAPNSKGFKDDVSIKQ